MLASSKRFKQLSLWKPKSCISYIQPPVCSKCLIDRLISRERANGSTKLWFKRHASGYILKYSPELQRRRHYQQSNFFTSTLVGSWVGPYFVNISIGNCHLVATQASPTEEELTDEFLKRIISDIDNDPASSREICSAYIENLCRDGKLSVAASLLQSLRGKHIFLTTNSYNLLLATASEGNDIGLVCQLFKDLLVSWEPISSTSFLNFAKAFMSTKDALLLLRFIKEVSELTFPRSIIIVNRFIFAFSECGQTDKALLIFDQAKSLKCKPDLVTYNTVLEILGRVGRANEMLNEFASMKEANIAPDLISYNTLINSLRKLGRLDACLMVLKEMIQRGFEPDLLTYKALIESFGRSGNVDVSLRLFDEMKGRGIRPSIHIYRSLINNLKKMGKLESATTLLEEMTASLSDLVSPKDFKQKNR